MQLTVPTLGTARSGRDKRAPMADEMVVRPSQTNGGSDPVGVGGKAGTWSEASGDEDRDGDDPSA